MSLKRRFTLQYNNKKKAFFRIVNIFDAHVSIEKKRTERAAQHQSFSFTRLAIRLHYE
jgi:hypothetical protein